MGECPPYVKVGVYQRAKKGHTFLIILALAGAWLFFMEDHRQAVGSLVFIAIPLIVFAVVIRRSFLIGACGF
jgi:hypothetical protein